MIESKEFEIIVNATNVSDDVLLWLKKDVQGYYVERRWNRERTKSNFARIGNELASKIAEMPIETAFHTMESFCMRNMG